jgi:DNA-binding MurR/RpiR family transcriptional regulator
MQFDTVRAAIKARYPAMSRQLQIGARFLLERPEDVATASMRAIAGRAGVTPVTLVRLARALGFGDWKELRRPFVERLRPARLPYSARAEDLVKRKSPAALSHESFAEHAANLAATEAMNAPREIAETAALLARARRVHVAGFRSCHALAAGFVYVYRLFRPDVFLVGGALGLELDLRALGEGDAVIVLGFAPYSRECALVIAAAQRAGARRIAVTDSDVSPLALGAERVLRFAHAGPSFFPSIAAASALLEALLAQLLARGGKPALDRLRAAERELESLGAYLPSERA